MVSRYLEKKLKSDQSMPKKENRLSVVSGMIRKVLVILAFIGLLVFVYLWRLSEYESSIEEILSTSDTLKIIAILIIVCGIALIGINRDSDDD